MKIILENRKVLITGASSGIGLTCAIYLTYKGFKVIGTSRHPEKLTKEILKNRYLEMHTKYRIKHRNSPNESLIKGKIHVPNEILNNLDKYIEDIEYQSLDITDSRSASEIIPKIMAKGVDILVNNAATNPHFGPILTATEEQWEKILSVNLIGYFRTVKACITQMQENGGGKIYCCRLHECTGPQSKDEHGQCLNSAALR